MVDYKKDIRKKEVQHALFELWNTQIYNLSDSINLPETLQEVEEFSDKVCHFDLCWDKFKAVLRQEAIRVGLTVSEEVGLVKIIGSKSGFIVFELKTFDGDLSDYPIDYEDLDGMTKTEALDYLSNLPDDIEEFKYVELSFGEIASNLIISDYPEKNLLESLFKCYQKEEKVIDEAIKRAELKIHKEDTQRAMSDGSYKQIKNALHELGWTGKFSVEHGDDGCVLMILLKEGGVAHCTGNVESIIRQLPKFVKFCDNYPIVDNANAFQVRTQNIKDIAWKTIIKVI